MAKKEQKKRRLSFRLLLIPVLVLLGIGSLTFRENETIDRWKTDILRYVDNRDIATLESRFTPEQILESNERQLFGDKTDNRVLKNTTAIYYPYLLLNVKYTAEGSSREGVLLWGLNDGEIVLDTKTWETTRGFRDCLECTANRRELKILTSLSKYSPGASIEELQKETGIEKEELLPLIEQAARKHLVVREGNRYRLHLENPKLAAVPQTRLTHPIVLKPQGTSQKIRGNYSHEQIIELAKAAFGSDFKILSTEEIYLPVYRTEVLNPDGSVRITEWNALTNRRLIPHYKQLYSRQSVSSDSD